MGSHGHRVGFDAAHSQATRFNELARLGTVGTVFHACCLLETTTNAFHIRMLPSAPAPAGAGLVRSRYHPPCAGPRNPCQFLPVLFTPSPTTLRPNGRDAHISGAIARKRGRGHVQLG